jgi:hypothetical protein
LIGKMMRYTSIRAKGRGASLPRVLSRGFAVDKDLVEIPAPAFGVVAVRPQPVRRRRLPVLIVAWLALAAGCERVHSRQWGYPNGLRRVGIARTPKVDLRFEANPPTAVDGATARMPPG